MAVKIYINQSRLYTLVSNLDLSPSSINLETRDVGQLTLRFSFFISKMGVITYTSEHCYKDIKRAYLKSP